ncbi:MAG: hypothetical protein WD046_00080 [Paracoccaceae bacterium]
MRTYSLVLICTLLAACFSPTRGIVTSSTVVAGGVPVVVAGPAGFCIDERTGEQNRAGAFVILSDCGQTEAGRATIADVPLSAVLVAAVSPSGLLGARERGMGGALGDLEAFLRSPVGLPSLGKGRVPGAVSIIRSHRSADALYILVQDLAAPTGAGLSQRYWRAFTEVNGRLASLSANSMANADASEAQARALAEGFVAAMQAANAASARQAS